MATGLNEPTIETLERLLDAFNAHDLDSVMSFFVDDCVLEMPRGPDPWGRRLEGSDRVREGLAGRFAGIPDLTTASTAIGSAEAADAPNGFSPVRPRRARGSRSAAATCSSSETTRSPGRTPTGRSSRRSLADRRPLPRGFSRRAALDLGREGAVSFCASWSSSFAIAVGFAAATLTARATAGTVSPDDRGRRLAHPRVHAPVCGARCGGGYRPLPVPVLGHPRGGREPSHGARGGARSLHDDHRRLSGCGLLELLAGRDRYV